MKKLLIAMLTLLYCGGHASAASMYKCVEKGGKVSYADHPCAVSSKEAWSSRLGTRSKTPKQIARAQPEPDKNRPQELARITAGGASSNDSARIDALRVEEMTRILGQQAD